MSWVKQELGKLDIPPLKRFGQHFLIDKRVRDTMITTAKLSVEDTVLEVGPGLGFLTAELAKRAGNVVAVEKDRTLALYLKDHFSKMQNLTVIQGDALSVGKLGSTKIVSSPPYNISSKLVLFIVNNRFNLAVLLLQDEFVQRLTARSGSREYGRITVALQAFAKAEAIKKVPRSAFYPSPKVDSAVVTITPRTEPLQIRNPIFFEDLVRSLFTQRRRKLKTVLTKYLESRDSHRFSSMLSQLNILEKRVFQMSPSELVDLANQISYTLEEG
jgi:16S rRNA (adenine1518-N6/adenine1519-N6)-dimethyltransferase